MTTITQNATKNQHHYSPYILEQEVFQDRGYCCSEAVKLGLSWFHHLSHLTSSAFTNIENILLTRTESR